MKKRKLHKALSMLLTAAMVMNMELTPVFAQGATPPGISEVCTHHTEHTEDCGYQQGTPCNHEHKVNDGEADREGPLGGTDDCSTQELTCALIEGDAPKIASDSDMDIDSNAVVNSEAAIDSDGVVDSGNGSAGAPHTHGEDCYTQTDNCKHTHDDTCGYTEGSPCTFDPESCAQCDTEKQPEQVCTCQPVDSGELVHGEDCPLYTAPKLSETVQALIALVDALPNPKDIAEDNKDTTLPDFEAAAEAYGALSEDDKAAFDKTPQHTKLMALRDVLLGLNTLEITTHPVTSEDELTKAINDANTGDIIQLTADFNFENNITFPTGKALILDLNSKTLTGGLNKLITIAPTAELTITDSGSGGTLSGEASTSEQTFVINNGTLNINAGTVGNSITSVVKNSGTFNLSGGTLSRRKEGSIALITNNSAGSFNYYGGTLLAVGAQEDIIVNNGGTVTIDRLNFVKTEQTTRVVFNKDGGTVDIKNSKIRVGDPGNAKSSNVLINSNGTAIITDCTISASGGSSQAISNGSYGTATITDCTISASGGSSQAISNYGTATITDCTISASGGSSQAISNYGTATISACNITSSDGEDNSAITNRGTLEITGGKLSHTPLNATGNYGAIDNYGTLTIHSGVFTSTDVVISDASNMAITINDGIFVSTTQRYPALQEGIYTVHNGIIISGTDGKANVAALLNKVYGTTTLTESVNIPSGKTLTVPASASLTIAEGVTLSNGGTLDNLGTVTNNGTVRNRGTVKTAGSDGNGVWSGKAPIQADPNVTVGNTPNADYESIVNAWNEAGTPAVITLTSDISFRDTMSMSTNASKNITLDLNGHTLEYTGVGDGFFISRGNTLTFKNGVYIVHDSNGYTPKAFVYLNEVAETITLKDCLILGDGSGDAVADAWKVHGTATLYNSYILKAGKTLTVPADTTLTIPTGVTLTNAGTIDNKGTIVNNGTIISSGTLTGSGSISGNGAVQTVLAADMITLSNDSYVYTGSAFEPTVTVASTPWTGAAPFVKGDDYTVEYSANTGVGTATVTVTPTGSKLTGTAVEKTFTITKANSALGLTTNKTDNTFTYGDTITFTANVSIPTTKARAATVNTVDFYCGDTKLNDSTITLNESGGTGSATFAYKTTSKGIPIGGDIEITAEYGGSNNLNGVTQTVNVALSQKPLTATVNTSHASATKVYDGNANFTGVALTLTGLEAVDSAITATANGTAIDKNVEASKTFTATGVTLNGTGNGYYNLATSAISGNVAITAALLNIAGGTVTPKKWDGTNTATVTELTFSGLVNGETLAIGTDYTVGSPSYNDVSVGTGKSVTGTASLVANINTNNYSLTGSYIITGDITLADGPAAPTSGVVDDTNGTDTFDFTVVSGITDVTKYEYSTDGGSSWATVTANPISVGNIAIPVGNLKVRIAKTATHNAGAILANSDAFTTSIEGTVSIIGIPTYGETLTASASGTQSGAVLHYQWKADTDNIGTNSATLVIPGVAVDKTITVEVTATGYADKLTSSPTSTVAKKAVTAATTGTISKVYDGTTDVPVAYQSLTIAKVNMGDDITVTMADATYNDTNAGTGKTITVGNLTITGEAKDWYTVTPPSSATGEITPKPLANSMISGINASYPYTGSEISPVPNVVDGDPSIIATSDYTVSYEANTNAGTAKVILTGNSNYSGIAEKTFTINKATGRIAITGNPTKTYDGAAVSEPDVNKYDSDGAVSFEWYEDNTKLAGAPTDAGSYTVKAIMAEGTNHTAATATKSFIIAKAAAPNITYPTAAGLNYGAKLSTSELTGGNTNYGSFAWEDASIVPTVTNSGYSVKFTPSEATLKNYEQITPLTQTVNVTVTKVSPAIDLKAQISGASGSRQAILIATLTKVGDGEIPTGTVKFVNSTSNTDVDITGATTVSITNGVATYTWTGLADQVYKVKVEYSGSDNYQIATATEISFDTRKQNQQNFAIAAIGTKTYGDGVFTLTTSGGNGSGAVSFTSSDSSTVSISGNRATILKAGNVIITANKAENDSYNEATATASLTVNKKAISFIANDMLNVVKGSQMPVFTYKPVTLATGDRITTEPTLTSAVTDTNTLGKFLITISGAVVTNADSYTINYVNGEMTVVEQLYTVTVADGTGGGEYSEGQTVSITANDKNGYTFSSWSSNDGVTFVDSNAKTTTFTMLGKNVTVNANYSQNSTGGGGGGGGSTPTLPVTPEIPNSPTTVESNINSKTDEDGNATAVASEKDITNAIDKAQKEAKKNGTEANSIAITLNVKTDKNATALGVTLPQESVSELIAANVTSATVKNDLSTVTLDLATLKTLSGGDVVLTVRKMDVKTLSAEAQNAIAGRPVFQFSLTSGGKSVSDFRGGKAGLQIPYTLNTTEQVDNLYVLYVDKDGKVNWLENSSYDPITGMMIASTSHFSIYGVGYKTNTPKFIDVDAHWAKNDIDFVVARGLLTGTSNTTFSPDTSMTRGMFVTSLGKLAGVDTTKYQSTKFTDVAATAYYAPYVAWANANNIVNGTSDITFSPDNAITRQEIAVMLLNYSMVMGYDLPSVNAQVTFTDESSIASWAKDGVNKMQMAGIMMGKGGNYFDPTATATRAEVSAMLCRYLELMASTKTNEG